MVRYALKVLKIREQSPFGAKFPVEFVPVFQKDLGWPNAQFQKYHTSYSIGCSSEKREPLKMSLPIICTHV